MRINQLIPLFLVINLLIFTGCSPIISTLYGIRNPKPVNEIEIQKYAKKYKIPIVNSYELDTSYLSFLYSLDTSVYRNEIKNHYQPLQVLYFDSTGRLISFLVNCYAPGFPNLKWNHYGILDTFPPGQQAQTDTLLNLDRQIKYLRLLSASENSLTGSYDYTAIVYWNKFMGRQSKRLVRYMQDNSLLSKNNSVRIIYANTDNIFAIDKKKL
jgi:hypothetical protein